MNQDELMVGLKRRVVELLQNDGMKLGVCDVAPGFTKHGAICKVTVEVLVPTEGSEPLVDRAVEQLKDMTFEAAVLFTLEELLGHFIQPGSQRARDMAMEMRRRRVKPPAESETACFVAGSAETPPSE